MVFQLNMLAYRQLWNHRDHWQVQILELTHSFQMYPSPSRLPQHQPILLVAVILVAPICRPLDNPSRRDVLLWCSRRDLDRAVSFALSASGQTLADPRNLQVLSPPLVLLALVVPLFGSRSALSSHDPAQNASPAKSPFLAAASCAFRPCHCSPRAEPFARSQHLCHTRSSCRASPYFPLLWRLPHYQKPCAQVDGIGRSPARLDSEAVPSSWLLSIRPCLGNLVRLVGMPCCRLETCRTGMP
mmetsp:Transcript_31953/g.49727  ORF Transcript_31953/g.49727 Transcript_31953/m.49727 type:complete len:243 (-) Transcript_31953:1054-1782(-)